MKTGMWTNGKRTITGVWNYHWPSDRFIVELKAGRRKVIAGEHPEWGNWKLVRQESAV
jgi:hypothetical protein